MVQKFTNYLRRWSRSGTIGLPFEVDHLQVEVNVPGRADDGADGAEVAVLDKVVHDLDVLHVFLARNVRLLDVEVGAGLADEGRAKGSGFIGLPD